MITVELDIDTRAITDALHGLEKSGRNPQPALEQIGEYLIKTTKQRFNTKTAPDGSSWADNSATTIARKGSNNPLIGESKDLNREFHAQASRDHVIIGNSADYSAVQHFGAKKGQFGKSSRGGPIPWGDIPARPYLGLSKEDELAIIDILNEYLEGAAT